MVGEEDPKEEATLVSPKRARHPARRPGARPKARRAPPPKPRSTLLERAKRQGQEVEVLAREEEAARPPTPPTPPHPSSGVWEDEEKTEGGPCLPVGSEPVGSEKTDQPTTETDSKGGPPKGNRNAIRHGLSTSKLPKGAIYIEKACHKFRLNLENAVLEARGEITLIDASAIDTATKWVRHEKLCARWLRLKADTLSPDNLLKFSRDMAKASTERDKAIRLLKLEKKEENPYDGWTTDEAE
jgi:hypothetical protein